MILTTEGRKSWVLVADDKIIENHSNHVAENCAVLAVEYFHAVELRLLKQSVDVVGRK